MRKPLFLRLGVLLLLLAMLVLPSAGTSPTALANDPCTDCRNECWDAYFECQAGGPYPDPTYCYDQRTACLLGCYETVCQ